MHEKTVFWCSTRGFFLICPLHSSHHKSTTLKVSSLYCHAQLRKKIKFKIEVLPACRSFDMDKRIVYSWWSIKQTHQVEYSHSGFCMYNFCMVSLFYWSPAVYYTFIHIKWAARRRHLDFKLYFFSQLCMTVQAWNFQCSTFMMWGMQRTYLKKSSSATSKNGFFVHWVVTCFYFF